MTTYKQRLYGGEVVDFITIVYEGGPANRTSQGVSANVHTIHYGPRGKEVKYVRTDRTDHRDRVVFEVAK